MARMQRPVHVVGVGMIPFTKPGASDPYTVMGARAASGEAPTADDLSNELDAEVCAVLLKLLEAGRVEDAGRALQTVREAAHLRYIARAWGDEPEPADYPMAALSAAGLA